MLHETISMLHEIHVCVYILMYMHVSCLLHEQQYGYIACLNCIVVLHDCDMHAIYYHTMHVTCM